MAANNVPSFTLANAMANCGLTATEAVIFATEVFMDDFETCKDITDDDLNDSFKTFSTLTVAQGQIRMLPGQKKKVKAFNQWVKDQFRLGLNPADTEFPVIQTTALLKRANTHKKYTEKAKTLSEAAKPEKFSKEMIWDDWSNTFINYIRSIPGRDGVPLQYIIRDNETADPTPNEDFLDDYIMNAPLNGGSFIIDANEVHTHLINLIAHNEEAEALVKIHETERNGRVDWIALKTHYEGQGIYANNITKAASDLKTLHYSGEKKPHMWWAMFEQRLNSAFQTYVKHEGRVVHSDEMKLRTLLDKIKCEWLGTVLSTIKVKLTEVPVTYTYAQALQAFKTEVNNKFPPGSNTSNTRRNISETSGGRGGRGYGGRNHNYGRGNGRGYGRGRGRGYGRGYGRGQGRGRGNYNNSPRNDSKSITLKDGEKIQYHASYRFADSVYERFTNEQKEMLKSEREAYRQRNSGNNSYGNNDRQVQQMRTELDDLRSIVSGIPESIGGRAMSQVSTGSTIMGGRNEQANKRKRDSDRE